MKKKMFRVIMLALMLAIMMTGCALADDGDPGEGITAVELTRMMGNGTNLGNTMEACDTRYMNTGDAPEHYETLWGQPVTTKEMIQGLKDAGFDTIRIPVAWMTNATHLWDQGDYTIDTAYMDRVEEIVNMALDADMFVIVNDHWDGGWYGMFGSESEETRNLAMEAYKGMWTQIAERFQNYSYRLIFEGANEEIGARFDENSKYCNDSVTTYLTDTERYALCNEVNQAFVDTVRSTGGNNATRFLLIPGYGTNIDQTFDQRYKMPEDTAENRLLVSVHYYDPWSYCGASTAAGATKWGKKSDLEAMNSMLAKMKKFTAAGYGVVIGEYGALPGSDGVMKDNAVTYHKHFLDNCDALDYVSCLWDTSGFYVRSELAFSDADMAALYAGRNRASEEGKTAEEIQEAAKEALQANIDAAPETFQESAVTIDENTCIAWIMWNDGGWTLSYSVGDTYDPDSISPGLVATDAVIDGEGDYTVGLDFTGTEQGYSASTAFSALGIYNGEILYPGWVINIKQVRINGEVYYLKGRAYTTSDDGKCTRVNLFNEWVTEIPYDKARTNGGGTAGITATPINRNDEVIGHIETIEIDFHYGPVK